MVEQHSERQALKRRGLIAGAAALVAAIAAKQTAQPVLAANLVLETNNTEAVGTALQYTGGFITNGAALQVYDTASANRFSAMVAGVTTAGKASSGVYGEGFIGVQGISGTGFGVSGISSSASGVVGNTNVLTGSGTVGVIGDGYGGTSGTGAVGVQGQHAQFGVIGRVNNAATSIAVWGNNTSTGANSHGVVGQSATGYGVLGYTTGGSASLAGVSDHTNIPAFAGGNSAPGGLASFSGTVYVNGMFVVADMTQKHGLLKHPDGSHRLMYTMEAPESWAEDFGTGTLTNGKADVKLDPDSAAVIHTEEYHVFITGHDEQSEGLVVTTRGASGFTVKERKGGTSSGTFSWRVVAKPKSDKPVERLGKFVVPNVPLPDVSKLPKPPETPPVPKKP